MKLSRTLSAAASAAVLSTLALAGRTAPASAAGSFVVSEAQFDTMFPSRNAFHTYKGLVDALSAYRSSPPPATTPPASARPRPSSPTSATRPVA